MVTKLFFRRFAHPWMVMALWIPIMSLMTYLSLPDHRITLLTGPIYILIGLCAWTLVEYGLHRFVFHWVEASEKWRGLSLIASDLHMQHHRSTSQADLIVAPPMVAVVLGAFVFGIFLAISRSFGVAAFLEIGLIAGYIVYEWVHFAAHRYLPKSKVGKFLRRYHLQHHHRDNDTQFGVTVPLWDWVFGTR